MGGLTLMLDLDRSADASSFLFPTLTEQSKKITTFIFVLVLFLDDHMLKFKPIYITF